VRQTTKPRPRLRLARAAFVLSLEIGVAVALVWVVHAAPATLDPQEPAVGADAVAADPTSFRAGQTTVRGRIVERPLRLSERDRGAFVMAGATGGRLLVVPADGAPLLRIRRGTTVVVRGTVVIPPNSRRLERRAASRTAIARRFDAPAVVKAVEVALP
jgi:hypothetical protein